MVMGGNFHFSIGKRSVVGTGPSWSGMYVRKSEFCYVDSCSSRDAEFMYW